MLFNSTTAEEKIVTIYDDVFSIVNLTVSE